MPTSADAPAKKLATVTTKCSVSAPFAEERVVSPAGTARERDVINTPRPMNDSSRLLAFGEEQDASADARGRCEARAERVSSRGISVVLFHVIVSFVLQKEQANRIRPGLVYKDS